VPRHRRLADAAQARGDGNRRRGDGGAARASRPPRARSRQRRIGAAGEAGKCLTQRPPVPPTVEEASAWIGFDLDDVGGSRIGRVEGLFVDADGGEPTWLVGALGRRGAKKVAVPLRECAGGGGRVWTAQPRQAFRDAPTIDPARPLLREHELAICAHHDIGEGVGRAAEVAARAEGAVTSRPAIA
jgi:hypothetical protein